MASQVGLEVSIHGGLKFYIGEVECKKKPPDLWDLYVEDDIVTHDKVISSNGLRGERPKVKMKGGQYDGTLRIRGMKNEQRKHALGTRKRGGGITSLLKAKRTIGIHRTSLFWLGKVRCVRVAKRPNQVHWERSLAAKCTGRQAIHSMTPIFPFEDISDTGQPLQWELLLDADGNVVHTAAENGDSKLKYPRGVQVSKEDQLVNQRAKTEHRSNVEEFQPGMHKWIHPSQEWFLGSPVCMCYLMMGGPFRDLLRIEEGKDFSALRTKRFQQGENDAGVDVFREDAIQPRIHFQLNTFKHDVRHIRERWEARETCVKDADTTECEEEASADQGIFKASLQLDCAQGVETELGACTNDPNESNYEIEGAEGEVRAPTVLGNIVAYRRLGCTRGDEMEPTTSTSCGGTIPGLITMVRWI